MVSPNRPEDEEFVAAAGLVDEALSEFSGCVDAMGIDRSCLLELLLRRLRGQRYAVEREADSVIDLEGWLELPWNDARFLIVTGMNEGIVPDSRISDIFLPDSLRSQLGLRHDADRLARDAYLMTTLIESRRAEGRICFVAGKTSTAGDPLKPSRLLFHCGDGELPERAVRLFGSPEERRDNHPPTVSFRLDASPPADLAVRALDLRSMRVTWFKDYLACPFRFYLKHVLGMESMDDEKRELDAMEFGALVHYALQRMAEGEEMRRCSDEDRLRDFLCAAAGDWVADRFGTSLPLQVEIQMAAAMQRLGAAARVQAGLARDGWDIIHSEMVIESDLEGMLVRGRIDRIDRHRDTGVIRLLDYKTSDGAQGPVKAHTAAVIPDMHDYARVKIEGKDRRWVDLQLPLYRLLLPDTEEWWGRVEAGYFKLPKAVNDTGVAMWEGFSDEVLESARACAEGVVRDVKERSFWPPAAKVTYDDYEALFYGGAEPCIDVGAFQAFMERRDG